MCFICPLSGLAVPGYLPGCRCISRMLTLVGCLQSLLQSSCFGSRTSQPPVLCHCSPCGPCQTSLSQEALEFISGSPPLPYCAVKSSSITYVVKRVWKLNLLPPLPVFFCHLWLQLLKECFCKRAPSSQGRKQTPSTVLFAHCPFWFFLSFLSEYTVVPQDLVWSSEMGWNCSVAHLCFSWATLVQWLWPWDDDLSLRMKSCLLCAHMCLPLAYSLTAHLKSGALNAGSHS